MRSSPSMWAAHTPFFTCIHYCSEVRADLPLGPGSAQSIALLFKSKYLLNAKPHKNLAVHLGFP